MRTFDLGARTKEIAALFEDDPVLTGIHTDLVRDDLEGNGRAGVGFRNGVCACFPRRLAPLPCVCRRVAPAVSYSGNKCMQREVPLLGQLWIRARWPVKQRTAGAWASVAVDGMLMIAG